ncbi:MAG: hypothetical protein AAF602_30925, partial [Myxococcota bacterium]
SVLGGVAEGVDFAARAARHPAESVLGSPLVGAPRIWNALPAAAPQLVVGASEPTPDRPNLLRDQPDVLLANTINVLATGLFLSRLVAPKAENAFAIATLSTAVPAAGLIAYNVHRRRPVVESIGPALWIAFAGMDVTLDYITKTNFRKPPRWGILGPFLALFYGSTITMWASTYRHGPAPYAVTTATYAVMATTSLIARVRERPGD